MVKDMTPREEQQGTRTVFVWSTIVVIAAAVGLMVWFFVPGFSQPGTPNLAANGSKSDETQGSSVTAQVTKPVPTTTPRSTDPTTVGRNERLTGSATPDVNLTPDQIHQLAHKGKKAACHSDNVKDETEAKLVQVNTLKAHGVAVNETGL